MELTEKSSTKPSSGNDCFRLCPDCGADDAELSEHEMRRIEDEEEAKWQEELRKVRGWTGEEPIQ